MVEAVEWGSVTRTRKDLPLQTLVRGDRMGIARALETGEISPPDLPCRQSSHARTSAQSTPARLWIWKGHLQGMA
jgi:hypothetical protein